MPHNIPMETAYMMKGGVASILSLKQYTQMGQIDADVAKGYLIELADVHTCLDKWFPLEPGWAFRCVYGAAGAYIFFISFIVSITVMILFKMMLKELII